MILDGFYYDSKWWSGNATVTRDFNFPAPVNVMAFGALSTIVLSGGKGCAYVGIYEAAIIDPNTGRPVNTHVGGFGSFPAPNFEGQQVKSITFGCGSQVKPPLSGSEYTIEYGTASMEILLWS